MICIDAVHLEAKEHLCEHCLRGSQTLSSSCLGHCVLANSRVASIWLTLQQGTRWLTGICLWLYTVIIWSCIGVQQVTIIRTIHITAQKYQNFNKRHQLIVSSGLSAGQGLRAPLAISPLKSWGRTPTASLWTYGLVVSLEPQFRAINLLQSACYSSVVGNKHQWFFCI